MLQFCSEKLRVFQSRIFATNSSIIEFENSVLICDPTWFPDEIQSISDHVNKHFPKKKKYLFISHLDYDHVWGWPLFQDAFVIAPDLEIFKNQAENCVKQWGEWDQGHYVKRAYKPSLPLRIDLALSGDLKFLIDNVEIRFVHLPGHTADSFAAFIPACQILLAGDYLSDVEIPWIGTSAKDYKSSLLKLRDNILSESVNITLVPGHGQVMTNMSAIQEIVENSLKYIDNINQADDDSQAMISSYIATFPFPEASWEIHRQNIDILKLKM